MIITHETNTAKPSQEAMLIATLSVALVPEGLQRITLFGRSSDSPEPVAFPCGWAAQWLLFDRPYTGLQQRALLPIYTAFP